MSILGGSMKTNFMVFFMLALTACGQKNPATFEAPAAGHPQGPARVEGAPVDRTPIREATAKSYTVGKKFFVLSKQIGPASNGGLGIGDNVIQLRVFKASHLKEISDAAH